MAPPRDPAQRLQRLIAERDGHCRNLAAMLGLFQGAWDREPNKFDELIGKGLEALNHELKEGYTVKQFRSHLTDILPLLDKESQGTHVAWPVTWEERWVVEHQYKQDVDALNDKLTDFRLMLGGVYEMNGLMQHLTAAYEQLQHIDALNHDIAQITRKGNRR